MISERQKSVFENHQRIEDSHLEEARQWEKKVENKRLMAANNWRAKMHCMQTIAEGRMADIERRKYVRKRNAVARKKAQVNSIKLTYSELPRTTSSTYSPQTMSFFLLSNMNHGNFKVKLLNCNFIPTSDRGWSGSAGEDERHCDGDYGVRLQRASQHTPRQLQNKVRFNRRIELS